MYMPSPTFHTVNRTSLWASCITPSEHFFPYLEAINVRYPDLPDHVPVLRVVGAFVSIRQSAEEVTVRAPAFALMLFLAIVIVLMRSISYYGGFKLLQESLYNDESLRGGMGSLHLRIFLTCSPTVYLYC